MARLLVVEDDPGTLEVLTDCLLFEDYEVCGVSQLSAALDLLRREPFDLVLTDLFTPTFSAASLTELGAYTQAAASVPIVVATAHAQAGKVDPASYGLADIILKPFDLDDLFGSIRHVLERQGQLLEDLRATSEQTRRLLQSAQEEIGKGAEILRRTRNPPQQDPGEP